MCIGVPLSVSQRLHSDLGEGTTKPSENRYETSVIFTGCSKRPSSKAAASEKARRTLRYVEPLSAARTPLADFFSILLGNGGPLRHDIAGKTHQDQEAEGEQETAGEGASGHEGHLWLTE